MQHHEIGSYYSGVKMVGEEESSFSQDPSGSIGAGVILIVIGDGLKTYIYNPIDYLFSGVIDTILLPVDAINHNNLVSKNEYDKAVKYHSTSYSLPLYQKGDFLKEEPLITAVVLENEIEVQRVIDTEDVDINKKDIFSRTAMDYALALNDISMVKLLLKNGVQNEHLFYDFISKDVPLEALVVLIQSDTGEEDIYEYKVLNRAIDVNRSDLLIYFLDNVDVDINLRNYNGQTPLMYAVKKDNYEMVDLLIKNGAYLNAANGADYTVLDYAQNAKNTKITHRLKDAGALNSQEFYLTQGRYHTRTRDDLKGVVVDKTSGLIWQDTKALNDINKETRKFLEAQKYCEVLNSNENTNWRVPSMLEWFSVFDTNFFKNGPKNEYYWSRTPFPNWPQRRWEVYNDYALDDTHERSYVRCVRGEAKIPKILKSVQNSKILEDTVNSLMWQNHYLKERDKKRDWQGSINYCESLKLGGFEDWKLPSKNELFFLTQTPQYKEAFEIEKNEHYWSSTSYFRERQRDPQAHLFRSDLEYFVVNNKEKPYGKEYDNESLNHTRCVRYIVK